MWDKILDPIWSGDIGHTIRQNLAGEKHYPPSGQIFRALELTPPQNVKVVILGQDPYHGGQADGLAFSVKQGIDLPPSLRNIWKELANEYDIHPEVDENGKAIGSLEGWARQGVLLLNTHLTVAPHQAASHSSYGWENLTDQLLRKLEEQGPHVYLLWGAHAQRKQGLLGEKSIALNAPHPSPLSAHRGFFGCGHFRKANDILLSWNKQPINWQNHV